MTASTTNTLAPKTFTNDELVPRLRFPEFRGEWKVKPLQTIASVSMGSSPKSENYNNSSSGLPFMQGNADVKNRRSAPRIFTTEITKECFVGDTLISVRAPVGRIARSIHHACIGRGLAAVRTTPENVHEFVHQWLLRNEDAWASISQGGTFDAIKAQDLTGFPVPTPTLPEQQKIADCLSSLDDLIAAESEKLETLKEHKKGLMQELFPREGETVPRIRFPEFEGSGEWEVRTLGKLLTEPPSYGVNEAAVPYSPNLPTYLRITDIDVDGNILKEKTSVNVVPNDKNTLRMNDIVVARTGASVGKSYRYQPSHGILVFAGFLIRLSLDSHKIDSIFLANYLTTPQYWKWIHITSVRSGQPGVNASEYASFQIPLPPTLREQQEIALTLSSLDDRITAHGQRIETLKEHKKGLMQQLFPVMEG